MRALLILSVIFALSAGSADRVQSQAPTTDVGEAPLRGGAFQIGPIIGYATFSEARAAFADRSCVYVQTDRHHAPIRIGKASKGLSARYHGGTGYALDAAMHESGNHIFVAAVPNQVCDAVERTLIWRFRHTLPYNIQGKKHPPATSVSVSHHGRHPRFTA